VGRPPARFATALAAVALLAPPAVGVGPRFRPPPLGRDAATTARAQALGCGPRPRRVVAVHLELFARGRVVLVPPGIGVRAAVRDGAYVRGGRCYAPLFTLEPTGVVLISAGRRLRLGDLFAVWRAPLSATRLLSFDGAVTTYVDGRRRAGDPRGVELRRHAEIVLEVQGHVPPHTRYLFAPGL
jgi:hypothetical protein